MRPDLARSSALAMRRILKATDYIEYLFQDPTTKVILAYLEGFGSGEGRTFYELIRNHPQRKPVIVLKPGSTESGRRAALAQCVNK